MGSSPPHTSPKVPVMAAGRSAQVSARSPVSAPGRATTERPGYGHPHSCPSERLRPLPRSPSGGSTAPRESPCLVLCSAGQGSAPSPRHMPPSFSSKCLSGTRNPSDRRHRNRGNDHVCDGQTDGRVVHRTGAPGRPQSQPSRPPGLRGRRCWAVVWISKSKKAVHRERKG